MKWPCIYILRGVAAGTAAQQTSSICTEPLTQPRNASLDAVVERATRDLAGPSVSWHAFMRGANLADRAVANVRVRDAPGPPASTLVYLTTACSPCHLTHLCACWPTALRQNMLAETVWSNALRQNLLAEADVLMYAGCRGAAAPSTWAHALAALPVRNVTLAWTRWNPGYQQGAMAAVMVAARKGWFDRYAWVLRANPDIRIEDASFLAARLRKPSVAAVLVRCRPRAPSICTDFFAARPSAFNHSAWGLSHKRNGRVNNELSAFHIFRGAIEGGGATVWNVDRAFRTVRGRGCRVGGRGIYHDHALCRRPRVARGVAAT